MTITCHDLPALAEDLFGLRLPPKFAGQSSALVDQLLRWNQRIRLTGHRDAEKVALDMVLDALALAPHLKGDSLLDIGSGAGFPGLPLALALPELSVTMLEGRAKKISFQKAAIRLLGLESRVDSILGRAGEHDLAGRVFDCVTLRAVTDLAGSVDLAMPYCAAGGRILLQRGPDDAETAAALGLDVVSYTLPQPFGPRLITIMQLA